MLDNMSSVPDPHGGRRKSIPEPCPLPPTLMRCRVHAYTHINNLEPVEREGLEMYLVEAVLVGPVVSSCSFLLCSGDGARAWHTQISS